MASYYEFKIPSKTFIVGEYLALKGGPSFIATTGPNFQVGIENGTRGEVSLHPDSPAGKFLSLGEPGLSDYLLDDPHDKSGGFGRSTAEFLSVYLYKKILEGANPKALAIDALVKTYQKMSAKKTPPSGADLVAQYMGGLCVYNGKSYEAKSFAWPWPSKTFLVFHSGRKLETHVHLEGLRDFVEDRLLTIATATVACFERRDYLGFAQCINAYSDELHGMGLFDSQVHEAVRRLRGFRAVDAAKGCGAMGVDTIFVMGDSQDEEAIIEQAGRLNFEFITGLAELGQGTRIYPPKEV